MKAYSNSKIIKSISNRLFVTPTLHYTKGKPMVSSTIKLKQDSKLSLKPGTILGHLLHKDFDGSAILLFYKDHLIGKLNKPMYSKVRRMLFIKKELEFMVVDQYTGEEGENKICYTVYEKIPNHLSA